MAVVYLYLDKALSGHIKNINPITSKEKKKGGGEIKVALKLASCYLVSFGQM